MKTVVITGSTRGLGLGMAEAFLERGCNVVVSGRSRQASEQAAAALGAKSASERSLGWACDVSDPDQLAALWQAAAQRFGGVDVWINNAGASNALRPFWELETGDIHNVVATNLLGSLYGSRLALQKMRAQGQGAIYNLEGYGSSGSRRMTNGLSVYGTTKAGLHFLNQALAAETAGSPVLVGGIQPGMVMTDMVIGQYRDKPQEWKRVRRIFNIIAERVDVVAPWIAGQVLANTQNGALLQYSSSAKLMLRFLLAPIQKRDIFQGIREPGEG